MKNSFPKLLPLFGLLVFAVSCTTTKTTTDVRKPFTLPDTAATEATKTWHLQSAYETPYLATGVEQAYRTLLKNKSPQKKVIVAIIDSGTDVHHEDLADAIWKNDDEIPGNGVDDDNNGYVDDIYGWNFIGGPDSTHVNKDTYEVTRLYAKLSEQFGDIPRDSVPESQLDDYAYYQEIKTAYERRTNRNNRELFQISQFRQAVSNAKNALQVNSIDSLSAADLQIQEDDNQQVQQAKQIISSLKNQGATETDIQGLEEYYEHVSGLAEYGLNPDFNPRDIVGDDYDDLSDRYYGNNDVHGPTSEHGTHVAGIVGAIRNNNLGATGIANNVELMILRTVPDGDERDKDVANSIFYAANNGANIINMSFGKGYSPQKAYVDKAVRYADSLGVLMVTGAGNSGDNIDSTDAFPNPNYLDGGEAENYLNVGASSWKTDSTLAASFSNYGPNTVHVFAPGVDIYSTYPDDTYEANSGTSMASPVVAGVAALMMSYYPELSTTQVKEILLKSSIKPTIDVVRPGDEKLVPFSELSVTGGIINAYEAIRMAEEYLNK